MPVLLSHLMEACRWIGALIVILVHTTNCFVNLGDIMTAPHAPPVYAWWFLASFELGHQAVVGFFVMSGYLVGGAVLAHLRKGQDFLRDYFIHRVTRIYLVVVPAVLLTLVVDGIGRWAFSDSGVYDWPLFAGHWTTAAFLGNIASLQELFTPYFGTNGPLWSLALEFWYYVTFPLLLLPFARVYSPALRYGGFVLGVILCILLSLPQSWFGFGYVLWALGAFATLLPRPPIRSRLLVLGLYAAQVVLIRLLVRGPLLAAHPWLMELSELANSTLFLALLLAFRDGPSEGFALLRPRWHVTLADFSFSLYAIHMPLLIFAVAAAGHFADAGWARQLATPAHYAAAVAAMAAMIVSAYGFSRVTEANTGKARRAMRRLLDRIAPAAPPAAGGARN